MLLTCVALWQACSGTAPAPPTATGEPTQSAPSQELKVATLFFVEGGSGLLAPCEVSLPLTGAVDSDAAIIISRYLQGPSCEGLVSPFLDGTTLRAVFLLKGDIAVVDLSGRAAAGGGSATETLRVYGLVNTLASNLGQIRSVRLLVDGREVETLLGHLDLMRPIPPEPSLLVPSAREAFGGAAR